MMYVTQGYEELKDWQAYYIENTIFYICPPSFQVYCGTKLLKQTCWGGGKDLRLNSAASEKERTWNLKKRSEKGRFRF